MMATPRLVRPTSFSGLSSLLLACQQGLQDDVCSILSRKPEAVSHKDKSGKTALHYCAENVHVACAEQVLDFCPELLNAQDDEGYTALHLAVISGNETMARFLIGMKADIDCVDNEKHTCVHWATVCGELECLDVVIQSGSDPSTPDIHGAYPIHYAAQMCGPNSEMGNNVKAGLKVLQKLLASGVDVNCVDKDGRQPLLWAASAETRASKTYCPSGSSDAILALVKSGADVSAKDKDGLTALHCAASRGHLDCLETLITLCGAEVDVTDSSGCTPLFYAVTLGHADCTNLLLSHNAKPNIQDHKGRTAAHCGASKGQLETLRILGHHRANLWLRNVRGDAPLHEAVQCGRKELVEWLLEQIEGSVNVTNINGRTPMHIAAITNNVELCKVLMDHGAFVNPIMKNSKGHFLTPLDAALHRGNRACAKYLQLHGALPSSKLVGKPEVFKSDVNSEQVSFSPEASHRVFRETSVQTETAQKDVDVQVRLRQRYSPTGSMSNETDTARQVLELRREAALKDSRKPIVAKVYLHTKRRDRRPLRRAFEEVKRRCQLARAESGVPYRKTMIPRFTRPKAGIPQAARTPRDTSDETSVKRVSEPSLRTSTVIESDNDKSTVGAELSPRPSVDIVESSKEDRTPQTSRRPSLFVSEEPTSIRKSSICSCCSDPYEDLRSLPMMCSCHCHLRRQSLVKIDSDSAQLNEATESEGTKEDLQKLTASSQDETETNKTLCSCCSDPYEDQASIASACPCTCHQRIVSMPKTDSEDQDESSKELVASHDVPFGPIYIEQLQSVTDSQEDEEQTGLINITTEGAEEEDESGVHVAELDSESQAFQEDIHKEHIRLEMDEHSPLSSLRSIESNVKDSGFSDFDRGDVSSEADDMRTSPKYKIRRKPIARFVVTSGAADAYPLDEDEEEHEVRYSTPRSASLPALQETIDAKSRSYLGRLALTKEVQKTLRKYQLERRLFYELQELKRQQICGRMVDGEYAAVQKMVERFRRHVLGPGMTDFRGPFNFHCFEKYLYEQLSKLTAQCRVRKLKPQDSFQSQTFPRNIDSDTEKHGLCVCQTHMCHHIRRPKGSSSLYRSHDKESVREIVLPEIPASKRRTVPDHRSKSWDRMMDRPVDDNKHLASPTKYDICKSLPTLAVPLPKRIPATLLAAIYQRLGPDVHLDDTVVVELYADDIKSKIQHAFSVREIKDTVEKWDEVSGGSLKPLQLERVLDPDDEGPVTFEIRHGNERNVFRLPTDKLKADKKWFLHFCLWPVGRYLFPTEEDDARPQPSSEEFNVYREVICLSTRSVLLLPNYRT